MNKQVWLNAYGNSSLISKALSVLQENGIEWDAVDTASFIQPVENKDFKRAVDVLAAKELLPEAYADALRDGAIATDYIVLRDIYGTKLRSHLTREDILVISMDYENIPVRISLAHVLIDLSRSVDDLRAKALLDDAGVNMLYEIPELFSLRRKSVEPIRYMSKDEVSRLINKKRMQPANYSMPYFKEVVDAS